MKDQYHYLVITETKFDGKQNIAVVAEHDKSLKSLIGKAMANKHGSFSVYKKIDWSVDEKAADL